MRKIRDLSMILGILICLVSPAASEISIGISTPNLSIGINMPVYPDFVLVPGLPVYYAPRVAINYFFYDGFYWVYRDDGWYSSDWYDGPWWPVEPDYVPLFILRIPVRYYRQPPVYFRGWPAHEPPRWGHHWGHDWERKHHDWNHWRRDSSPPPAPLPVYQRNYSGKRYPKETEQQNLRNRFYRYQPQDGRVREHVQPRIERRENRREHIEQRGEPTKLQQSPQGTQTTPQRRGTDDNRKQLQQHKIQDQRGTTNQWPSSRDERGQGQQPQEEYRERSYQKGSKNDQGEERGKGHNH